MNPKELIIKLESIHIKLLNICYYYGLKKYDAEDIIQDFLLNIFLKKKLKVIF